MRELVLHSEAEAELLEATLWYFDREPRVATRLLREFDRVAGLICAQPELFSIAREGSRPVIRRALLRRFPYGIVFTESAETIHVIAFAHLRRAPDYWVDRLVAKKKP